MTEFERIAERQIGEAIARGEFDNLSGKGKRIALDDDLLVPPDQRVAYRILKNAGYVPKEVELRRDIADKEAGLAELEEGTDRALTVRRINLLRAMLSSVPGSSRLSDSGPWRQ